MYFNTLSVCTTLSWQNNFSPSLQDVLQIFSPGGGGYGTPSATDEATMEVTDGEDADEAYNPAKRRRVDKNASQHYHEKGSVYAYRLAQEQV